MSGSNGSSRRKDYGGQDWRILGVRSRVSHPRLGIKTISIHPDVKQPFEVAVHSLDTVEVKKFIHRAFKYERTSKTRLVISAAGLLSDGLDVDSDRQLINHFIKWNDGYNERLYNYLSELVQKCKDSFKVDGGESAAFKSTSLLHVIATDELNHELLYDESLMSGLVKMCFTKTFLLNVQAATTAWYLLTKTDKIIRRNLLKAGIISGLIRSIEETKSTRAEDEIHTSHALKCLVGEVQEQKVEEFLKFASPLTADTTIEILLKYIKRCKRIDTIEVACILSSYLLPYANVKTVMTFGLDLLYSVQPDATVAALYAVAIGASHREGRKIMNELGGNKLFQKISDIGIDLGNSDSIYVMSNEERQSLIAKTEALTAKKRDKLQRKNKQSSMQNENNNAKEENFTAPEKNVEPMNLRISRETKPQQRKNINGKLQKIRKKIERIEEKKKNSEMAKAKRKETLYEYVSRALWGFASGITESKAEGSKKEEPEKAEDNKEVTEAEQAKALEKLSHRERRRRLKEMNNAPNPVVPFEAKYLNKDIMQLFTTMAESDHPPIAIGSTACLANLASSGALHGQNILFGLIDELETAPMPIIAEYIGAAISSVLLQRRSEMEENEPTEKRKSSNDNKIFSQIVLLIAKRARFGIEVPLQKFLASGLLSMSLPPVPEKHHLTFAEVKQKTPQRSPACIVSCLKLLMFKANLDYDVLELILCTLWALCANKRNAEIVGKVGGIESIFKVYHFLREKLPDDPADDQIIGKKMQSGSTDVPESAASKHEGNSHKLHDISIRIKLALLLRSDRKMSVAERKKINVIMQRAIGILYHMVFYDKNSLRLCNSRGNITSLLDVIGNRNFKLCSTGVAIVWQMTSLPQSAAQMIKFGFVKKLLALNSDPSMPTSTRQYAANALEAMAANPKLLVAIKTMAGNEDGDDSVIERMLIRMISENDYELMEYGCRSLARLAMNGRHQVIMNLGGIKMLLRVSKVSAFPDFNAANEDDDDNPFNNDNAMEILQQKSLHMSLLALRNLSVFVEHQQAIAKLGLNLLLTIGVLVQGDSFVKESINCILHNLSKNPKNRTTIYKTQLHSQLAKLRYDYEYNARKVLNWKARSSVYRRLIEYSGACEVQDTSKIENAKSPYEIKRLEDSAKSWIRTPQAGYGIIPFEDKLLLPKQPTLSALMTRPMEKMWAEGHSQVDLDDAKKWKVRRHKQLWQPDIVAYEYESGQLPANQHLLSQSTKGKKGVVRFTDSKFTKPRPRTAHLTTGKSRRNATDSSRSGRSSTSAKSINRPSSAVARTKSESHIGAHENILLRPGTAPTGEQIQFQSTRGVQSATELIHNGSNGGDLDTNRSERSVRPSSAPSKHRKGKKNVSSDSKTPFDLLLRPETSHMNRISFHKPIKPTYKPMNETVEQPGVKIARFRYIPGNKVSRNLFSHYKMPDGRLTHYFCKSEIEQAISPGALPEQPEPYTLSQSFPGFNNVTEEPLPPNPSPSSPSANESLVLNEVTISFTAPSIDTNGQNQIIFEDEPALLLTDEIKIAVRDTSRKHIWTLDESVFAPRKRISDSKDFYDTPKVKKKAFKIDWANATAKKRFVNFILREDDDGGKEELYEVRDVIWECYDTIMDAYEFYSVAGSSMSSVYTITLNSYSDFVADCKIPDNNSKTCKRKDLDTIFIVANVEEDKSSKVNKTNDDRALMRFEFLEVVIRIAVQKYLRSGDTDDVSDAVRMLCDKNIRPNLDEEAIHDSNQFRKNRLYFEDVDKCMKKHMSRLKMIFKVFAKPKVGFTKFDLMDMEEWFFLLKCCDLFDEDFTQREGKLAFAWSQMAVADEIRRRLQFKCITFADFLEALARVCDMKALPTDDDILKAGVKTTGQFFKKMTELGLLDDFCRENPCHWNEKKTRRMGELRPKFFDLIFTKLDRDGDGDFDKSDLQKWIAQGHQR